MSNKEIEFITQVIRNAVAVGIEVGAQTISNRMSIDIEMIANLITYDAVNMPNRDLKIKEVQKYADMLLNDTANKITGLKVVRYYGDN
jgi:hypothetical protein